ncbi:glucosaminidase domain-containing protein [Shewanella intestini]|uniref:Glucosaminidase n=1 Tax=Shewanella intestini TaxID=2017544 RepID=A0ABS5HZS0_9GAMM|nr:MULTISPECIES: glucosaminidase domain-containing protein [Shewanella]MBR9727283.1 glucosaminidase [Shewanella intestini]MRG36085.1 glucosaminidase [Shewanella sp. XMDDZSB0408]
MKTGRVGKFTLALATIIGIILFARTGLIPFIEQPTAFVQRLIKSEVTPEQTLPDFKAIDDVTKKKATFFDFFRPMVIKENNRVLAERKQIQSIIAHLEDGQPLTEAELYQFSIIAKRYRLDADDISIKALNKSLLKIDTVPMNLVLVQAANESGWGSSRFSQQGNNFFGQWCFSKGCGLVPLSRSEGLHHEVAKFDTPNDSVIAYINNLNNNQAYGLFRSMRADLRAQHITPTAEDLVYGLIHYSERKEAYIDELLQMLRHNEKLLQG